MAQYHHKCYRGEIIPATLTIDTDSRFGDPTFYKVEGGVEVAAASRAKAIGNRIFLAEEDYGRVVVIRRGFNTRRTGPATISGTAVAWSYSDSHGSELVAVLRRPVDGGELGFTMWIPGHHGHGPGTTSKGVVLPDGAIRWERAPSAPRVKLDPPLEVTGDEADWEGLLLE
jgi:hypothetical protein